MTDRTIPEPAVGAALPRDLSRYISRSEKVEAELDAFISKRHYRRVREEGERPEEAAWKETERRYTAARRETNRMAWHEYHLARAEGLRENLRLLIEHHERQAQRYAAEGDPAS